MRRPYAWLAPGVDEGFVVEGSEIATVEGPGRSRHFSSTSDASRGHRAHDHHHHDGELAAPRRVLVAGRDLFESHLRVGGRQFLHLVPEVFATVLIFVSDPSGDVVPRGEGM